MDARIDWIWLQQALGPEMPRRDACFPTFAVPLRCGRPSPGSGWKPGFPFRNRNGWPKETGTAPAACWTRCCPAGDWVLTPEDAYYPSLLLGLPDFPLVLYGRGEMPDLEHLPTVGMVGTRKCSDEGRRAAGDIARELSLHGVVIVSGGAEGIDAASHWGALYAGGLTVAVQACGLDVDYPALNGRCAFASSCGTRALC